MGDASLAARGPDQHQATGRTACRLSPTSSTALEEGILTRGQVHVPPPPLVGALQAGVGAVSFGE
eukprot:7086341-Alexandrium_andersonii.AAC.1